MIINNDDENEKNYYLYFEITDINVIKFLFESLDKNVDTVRFILTKLKKSGELEISCSNTTRTFYFKSKFCDKLIKNVICDKEQIEIELLPNDIVNILKSFDSTDNLLLFYIYNDENKKNFMTIEFKQTNLDCDSEEETNDEELTNSLNKKKIIKKTKKNKKNITKEKKFSIKIAYLIYPEKKIAKIDFDKKISINPIKFHNICKDLDTLFDYVRISSKNDKNLYFGYDTSKCDGIIKLKYNEKNVILENITNLKNNNINGIYRIEDIIGFSKLLDITTNYNFKIKNNYLLESTYTIGEFGTINILYVPFKEDVIKNLSTLQYDNYDNSDNLSNLSVISDTLIGCDLNNELDGLKKKTKNKKTINDKIVYVEIDKIELFKSICECIEKIITEPIFKLEVKDNNMTIKIICSNNSKNINFDICIENIFGRFKKLDKPINIGIGLKYLNDILKTTNKTDKIILSVDEKDKHNLTIQIKNINNLDGIELKRIYKIKLLNVEEIEYHSLIKLDNYKYKISICPNEFYKICKDINTIGEEIKIVYDDKNLILSSMNECKYVNIIKKDNEMINIEDKESIDNKDDIEDFNKIINEFEIKDIMIFNKLSGFMNNLDLYLKRDNRFIIESNLNEMMGSIKIQYLSKNILDITPNDKKMIKSDIESMENKLIFFKLKKINFMKNIIDTLDKMVSEVEWIFSSNHNNYLNEKNDEKIFVGLEITCMDPSKTLYVKTKLTDELFKSYYCRDKIFKFGMSLEYFNKILKLVEKNDIAIYCYIEKNDPNNLVIRIKNTEKKNKKIFKIPLQIINSRVDKTQLSLNFEKKIILKCENLFEKCKIINNNSQFIKIECDGEKLIFKCVGDKEGILTLDKNDDESLEIINLDDNKVECAYEIKNILMFSRLSSITEEFSFYMKNNFALTSIYNFGAYGSLSVILSPSSDEYINNQQYDYSDDDEEIELLNTNSNILDLYLK
jgi:hypothetical protein